ASAPIAKQLSAEGASLSRRAKMTRTEPLPRSGYDPGAQIQTGPGEPAWRWQTVALNWSGPVLQDQTVRLYLLSPMLHKIWRLVSVLLVFCFAVLLLRAAWPTADWRAW